MANIGVRYSTRDRKRRGFFDDDYGDRRGDPGAFVPPVVPARGRSNAASPASHSDASRTIGKAKQVGKVAKKVGYLSVSNLNHSKATRWSRQRPRVNTSIHPCLHIFLLWGNVFVIKNSRQRCRHLVLFFHQHVLQFDLHTLVSMTRRLSFRENRGLKKMQVLRLVSSATYLNSLLYVAGMSCMPVLFA